VIAGPVGHNRRIDNFPAGAALPGIKGADEIEIFFREHTAFAFRTFHDFSLSPLAMK